LRLTQLLGGDLKLVYSEPGMGSEFLATVKANLDQLSPNERSLQGFQRPEYSGLDNRYLAGVRILVADDSPDNQMLIEHYLAAEGAIVDVANNGSEAVEKALHGDYHLILMDIQMPVVDGYDATQRLRRTGYKSPIVALTAHALKQERERSLREGCNEHLTKPVNRRLLIATIGRLLYGETASLKSQSTGPISG
jgi:CheY-like chemotaxis protein